MLVLAFILSISNQFCYFSRECSENFNATKKRDKLNMFH